MLEAIRIRKAGYAIRVTQEDFCKRYRAILGKRMIKQIMSTGGSNINKVMSEAVFKTVLEHSHQHKKILDPAAKRWQVGLTKIFMKEDVRTALESSMGLAVVEHVKQIQKLCRGF
jgi:myosin heavy subunit